MADTINDTRTPGEILADAVALAEKTGQSYITVTNVCAERIIECMKEREPKTGHWLKKMSSCPSAIVMGGSRISACDLCGGWGRKTFKYCPHCGAKMEKATVSYKPQGGIDGTLPGQMSIDDY